ncbi:MAG: phosphatase PAP2 family protein [Aestuariivirga sp.]
MRYGKKIGGDNRIQAWISLHFVRPNFLPLVFMVSFVAVIVTSGRVFDFPVSLNFYTGMTFFILAPSLAILALCAACFVTLLKNRPDRPAVFLFTKLIEDWRLLERIASGLPIFLGLPIVFSAFTSYKSAMGKIVPFYADPYALAFDRMIHGTDPWRLLHFATGFPFATKIIDIIYIFWFLAVLGVISIVIFVLRDERLRSQYLSAFMLSWILVGCLAATLLSSAGPCYYSAFYASDPYADLFHYLDQVGEIYPLKVLGSQEMLLKYYTQNVTGFGAGISALPSMHVAVTVLNGIFLSKINRVAGIAAWIFAAIIFVGSVHLGWHYAIDGYAAALLVFPIWFIAGKLADRFEPPDKFEKYLVNMIEKLEPFRS